MDIITIILLSVLALLVVYTIFAYNNLVTLKNRTQEAWSDIDVQLKRRYDLIPNLIETVKGYAEYEKGVFEEVTKARTAAINANGVEEQGKAENMLTGALKSVFAVAESYPDLKASENFQKLQDELTDTENKIQASRRYYNTNVLDLNIKVEQFPSNIIARMFSFSKKEMFEIVNSDERENVKVKF